MTPERKKQTLLIVTIALALIAGLGAGSFLREQFSTEDSSPSASASPSPSGSVPGSGEASPTLSSPVATSPVPQVGDVTLATGTFDAVQDPTSGTATLVRAADGSTQLQLTDFSTGSEGSPDVYLSVLTVQNSSKAATAARADLGPLQSPTGNQVYTVPADAGTSGWKSVIIWDDDAGVALGAAPLAAAPLTPRE